MSPSKRFQEMVAYIEKLQTQICEGLESVDTAKFIKDPWVREEGGGGLTRVISNGSVFEKGGVNISTVYGSLSESAAKSLKVTAKQFSACGLSLVIHPFSPKVPTIHANVRYFETDNECWYGGGIDLTPYYPAEEDFSYFHSIMKKSVENIMPGMYPVYKKQCDDYFTITHRKEMRGIGGIFFDHLNQDLDLSFNLVQSVGNSFLESYLPIVKNHKDISFESLDKEFQLIRRGRYVEFNLMYDRGTIFGLHTNGRVESILMSLPAHVSFTYNYEPPKNTPQSKMLNYYQPKDWV